MNKKKKMGITVAIGIVVVIAMAICVKICLENEAKQRVIDNVTQRATSAGLKDVVVTIDEKIEGYDLYRVFVDCSNMEELSIDEMFTLDNSLRSVGDEFIVGGYTSNGNRYGIFPSDKSVSKNGEEIYGDYWNSESYKSTVEKENEDYNSLSYYEVTDDDTLGEIWAMAQSFVEDKLKSPKSADFPVYGDSNVSITNSGNYYKVSGYVDAENSFGAEIRTTFSLVMEKSGSNYTLKECNFNE